MRKILLFLVLPVLTISIVGLYKTMISPPKITNQEIALNEGLAEEVEQKIQSVMEKSSTSKEDIESEIVNQSLYESQKDPFHVVEYFFAAIKLRDVNLFSSFFSMESFNEELFRVENPNKEAVIRDYMEQISRNEQIVGVIYKKESFVFGKKKTGTVVEITYADGKTATVNLLLEISEPHAHTQHEDEHGQEGIYLINNSVENIINQIKEQTS
jgi:hypothetical protein